jgi:hypothetical protein
MRTIHTELRVIASPENVWKALVVSPAIPAEIRNAIRDRRTGVNMRVPMSAGGRGATLTVKLLAVVPFREIRWKGYLWVPGLFDGEHSFEIQEDSGGKTLLVQSEKFTGVLLPLLSGTISDTKQEFETMNAGIRDQAERIKG